ncbi:FAD-dependent oxidoreductase [Arthrobacter sp.]|uniref:FAD-dependent oxidoreductase n=1 Tax=Arthrobacter sp. TaxID=1667 RepID=UPI003A8DA7E2
MNGSTGPAERIVVLGFGPVAARFVDDLLPHKLAGTIGLTVIGGEVRPAYNRVLVADVATGRTDAASLSLAEPQELAGAGVDLRLGTSAVRVDRSRRRVLLSDGSELGYDRLVFATGSRPAIPVLRGLDFSPLGDPPLPEGVMALRDLDDAARLARVVRTGGRVVVLGGGILGVEAALAIREAGAVATLVHHGPVPLARALDHDGGRVLAAALADAGIEVVPDVRAVGVRVDGGRFSGLDLEGGRSCPGDALVVSVGVRPRTELAEGCGLVVTGGIRVDERLCADTEERVFAIGDCAAVQGRPPSCLIGPGWTQASWLAGHLARLLLSAPSLPGPAARPGLAEPVPEEAAAVIMLKARGVDLAAAGTVSSGPWDPGTQRVSVWADPGQGRYCKLVTEGGVLTGFIAIGMPRTAAELVLLYERGDDLPADRSSLFRLDDAALPASARVPEDSDVLCRCSGATFGEVQRACDSGCSSVDAVGSACRAGTGCGGCRTVIEEMLASAAEAAPA